MKKEEKKEVKETKKTTKKVTKKEETKDLQKEEKKEVKKEVKKPKKEEKVEIKKEVKKEDLTLKINKKKLFQGIGVVALVIAILGLAFFVSKNTNHDNANNFQFIDITIDEYLNKMQEDEKSIIYVARPGCSWCQKEQPIIKRVGAENKLEIYYLNTDPFWNSETNTYTEQGEKFINSSEKYKDGWGTPNTIIVGNGKIIDGEFSYVERNKLIDLFKRNGFING